MEAFTITAAVTYSPMLTPKGCRKPRPVPTEFAHEIVISRPTKVQAPVAVRHSGYDKNHELRFFEDSLYRSSGKLVQEEIAHTAYEHKKFAAIDSVEQDFRGRILIGDELWVETAEPVLQVMTYGMGGNHGGTSLSIRQRHEADDQSACFHPLTDLPAAIEAARATAERRGDTDSVANMGNDIKVEVLIPEAIKLKPLVVRRGRAIESSRLVLAEAYATVRTAEGENLAKAAAALEKAASDVRDRLSEVGLYSY